VEYLEGRVWAACLTVAYSGQRRNPVRTKPLVHPEPPYELESEMSASECGMQNCSTKHGVYKAGGRGTGWGSGGVVEVDVGKMGSGGRGTEAKRAEAINSMSNGNG